MLERLKDYRRERVASHEIGEATPLPPEIEEGGLVNPWLPKPELCYPKEPVVQHEQSWDILQRPTDLNPYEANQVRHWEQRRRNKRITDYGKK